MSQPTVTDECYFLEKLEENHYNTYQPQKYQERKWYVGLKKNGKPKLGPRTHVGQKAVFFLPRHLDVSGEWRCSSQQATKMKRELLSDGFDFINVHLTWFDPDVNKCCENGRWDGGLHYLKVKNKMKLPSFCLWCIFIRAKTSCRFVQILFFILIKMHQS